MIKYITYNSFDEDGQHIIPINSLYQMNKTAASNYAPEIMKVILHMKRKTDRYYVVINALGSYEVWGANRNGDAFPESGLVHKSLRTDMNTVNDYGYKTFEYYAKFYKHHVNKDPKRSFGEIVFAYWNPILRRVELICAIDAVKGADIVKSLETNEPVAVSMGCFTDPEYPILTMCGYKPMKDIQKGEIVFTHKKNWKKVTKVFRRKYTGKLYTLHMRGLPLPLELTADHPMMAKLFKKDSKNKNRAYINTKQFEKIEFDWADAEQIETSDHIEYIPVRYNKNEFCKIENASFAKLMGYYVAKGSFGYNGDKPCNIQLTCNIDDDLPREVPIIINELFDNVSCSTRPRNNSPVLLDVIINSTDVACFMLKYFDKTSHKKKIPPEMFVSDKNIKLSFLSAWLSGDGWCDNKGVHWSTCNINLALQARDLLFSCGIPSSIYKITHKAGSGFSSHDTIVYTLNISSIDAEMLIPYSNRKLKNLDLIIKSRLKNGNAAIQSNSDGTSSYSIKSIDTRDCVDVQTYNFEVEDDESYIAAGLVSHNCRVKFDRCSICDNKAKTRKTYCKHLKNYMGQIVTGELAERWSRELGKTILTGVQVFAWNDFPRFFDLSRVYIGADRTSFILGKAASAGPITLSADIADAYGVTDDMVDKFAQVSKSGEISKNVGALGPKDIDGLVAPISKPSLIRKALNEKMNSAIVAEPKLPKPLLNSMASTLQLKTILSTLLGLGIHPKPEEFQRIVLVRMQEKQLADDLDDEGIIFNHKEDVEPQMLDISNRHFSDTLGRLFTPYLQSRSCFPSLLEPRLKVMIIKTGSLEDVDEPMDEYSIHPGAALAGLAALYTGLKIRARGFSPKHLAEIFATKPWLRAVIGGGVVASLYDRINESDNQELLRPATDYENILQDTNFSGHIKQSGARENALGYGLIASGLALPSMYVANVYNQKSLRTTGRKLFPGAGVSPSVAAIGTGAGAAGISAVSMKIKGLLNSKASPLRKKLLKLM